MSNTNQSVVIKQLAYRLESTSSNERIDALQELQSLARSAPDLVGEIALRKTFDLLREQSSAEEYSEALDLTSRLVKCRDKNVSLANTRTLLSDTNNVELLLDLLEHSDLTVGVMTSQILTELHANDGPALEAQIQQCPDGMNKLLQRLPDSAREEVRNQAIVLIQQLTSMNEEMKKTVVFNEGFEILFRIIGEEGGSVDAGLVVNDCLRICNNILTGSETCQRLFFAMGMEWISRLADFFNPAVLESMGFTNPLADPEDEPERLCWFDQSSRLSCAIFAQMILYNALNRGENATKHQNLLNESAPMVIHSSAFWIARNGPMELVSVSLSFLAAIVANNPQIGHVLSNLHIKVPPAIKGKNIPVGRESVPLHFGWKPLPNDDRRYISLLSLLAERYVYPTLPWNADGGTCFEKGIDVEIEVSSTLQDTDRAMSFDKACIALFEKIISVDSTISDMMVQYILAPPPPPMLSDFQEDYDPDLLHTGHGQLDMMKPLGGLLTSSLIQTCDKLSNNAGLGQYATGGNAVQNDLQTAERVLHLLSMIFMHGSQLARELSTAITTGHIRNFLDAKSRMGNEMEVKPLLPLILATVGRAARLPGGSGYSFVLSILQWLAIVANGCERATHQMFEDPSNLFVVDLATSASEVAGVPPAVQVMACLFLGCCCLGFPSEQHDDNKKESTATAQGNESSILQRRPFLSMIDSRIGLNRFTETLKKPLIAMSKKSPSANLYEGLFHLPGFKAFYETQVESIRNIIFELYSGPTSGVGNGQDSAHSQVIALQQEKIKELEDKVEGLNRQLSSSSPSPTNNTSAKVGLDTQMQQQFQQKQEELEQKVQELQQQVVKSQQRAEDYEDELQEAAAKFNLRNQEAEQWQAQVSVLQGEVAQYQQKTQQDQQSLAQLQQALATKSSQVIDLESSNQRLQNELQGLQGEYHAIQQRYALLKEESDKKNKSEITSSQEMFVLEIEDLRSKYQALQHENECLNDELLRIKGSILSESQTRKQLQDLADQKERKLQMLESELTATRSLMDSTEAKKQEVKEKNVELVDLLKAKEEFIAQLQLQMVQWQEEQQQQQGGDGSTKPVLSLPSPIIETKIERVVEKVYLDGSNVLEALLELITSLALQDQEEVLQIAKKIHLGEMKFDEDTIGNVAQVLSACKTVIVDLAGECSDMAEGLRILHLQGAEGSVERIRDCFQQCMNQIASLQEAADTIPDLEVLVEELQSSKEHCLKQIEHLQESIQTHKDVNADLHRELSSKDCQIASFASTTASFEQQASQEMQLKQEMLANEKLLEDLNKTQHDIEDQEKAIAELSTTKSVLEGVVQALKQQLEEMQKQSLQSTQNLQNEVQVLKQALQNKEQEISTAWKSKYDVLVQELDIERNGRQHEKDQMQQEVSRAQQQQAALSKHVLEVEEELKHATLQQQRQVQQVQDQHDEISKLQQLLQGQHQTHHKEAEQYKLLLKSKQEECAELQEEIKKLSKASTYVLHPQDDENFSDVQRLQEQEMKRLSHLIDRYQRELAERDAEIREIKSKLSVKEGEVAGLRTAMQVDIQENKTMRQEIDNLQSKCTKEQQKNRSLQDDIDMLQEKIQRLTTLDQTIHSVRSSPAVKSRANNTVSFTGTSRRSQADTEDELGGSLSHMMSSMMSSPAATPMKSSNYSHSNAATTVLGMGGNDENKHNTQVYHTPSNQHHETDKIIITNSGRKLVEAQSVIKSASPAAKEAARLNAEVLKERKKYYELQEQHMDLLSLLAQQEVELNVFRQVVADTSNDLLEEVETTAQKNVIQLYGSYTNFRKNADFF